MIKELQYTGYATEPSDYECQDGQLAMSLNLISEDNQLKPIFQPSALAIIPDGYSVVYIHGTNSFKHYILIQNSTKAIFWIDEKIISRDDKETVEENTINSKLKHIFTSSSEIINIRSIGNILLVLTSDGMHYILWKNPYIYLGTHLPECPISFGLQCTVEESDTFNITFDAISEDKIFDEFSDDNKKKITSQVLAKVNKFIAEKSTNNGRFIYPFLVRYAYRLFDGSLTMHSAPVLMIASSDIAPQVFYKHITGDGEFTDAELSVVGALQQLDYAVVDSNAISSLKQWKDIVRSVDIFISKPIYTYDQNGECKQFVQENASDPYCVCKHINQKASTTTYPLRYQKHTFNKLYAFTFNPDTLEYPQGRLMLPKRTLEDIKQEIGSCGQFYFLKSINVENLTTSRTIISIENDYLKSLVTREVMTDDYDSHDLIIPKYAFGYNSRINLANIKKQLFKGFNTAALFGYANGYIDSKYNTSYDTNTQQFVYVCIKQEGKDIVVRGDEAQLAYYNNPAVFLFYPNVNAYKAYICRSAYSVFEVPLEPHPTLNGAFWFGGWTMPSSGSWSPTASSDRTIELCNKIYTSEVNNPFFFPLGGINTVGTGKIIGISTASKALSDGQFGQFPLYCFSDEGIWALEVSASGTYNAKQPITRDVCINTDSITQLDDSVLFATNRGIMLIKGAETICITDTIYSEAPFDVVQNLPYINQIHSRLGHNDDTCIPIKPFLLFLQNCKMIYDYLHQRVIIFNPKLKDLQTTGNDKIQQEYTYAYVFSLKSKQWGMIYSNLKSNINSYPDALAMTHNGELISFNQTNEDVSRGMLVTRPLKLDARDIYKTVTDIFIRGHFRRGDVATVIYGSNDLFNWTIISTSKEHYIKGIRGTPYKFFRIAVVSALSEDKSLFGISINAVPKLTNSLI